MRKSNVIASCGMMAALSVVLMILGAALGLGLYLSPMLGGLSPSGRNSARSINGWCGLQ